MLCQQCSFLEPGPNPCLTGLGDTVVNLVTFGHLRHPLAAAVLQPWFCVCDLSSSYLDGFQKVQYSLRKPQFFVTTPGKVEVWRGGRRNKRRPLWHWEPSNGKKCGRGPEITHKGDEPGGMQEQNHGIKLQLCQHWITEGFALNRQPVGLYLKSPYSWDSTSMIK